MVRIHDRPCALPGRTVVRRRLRNDLLERLDQLLELRLRREEDLESLEAISTNRGTRRIFLRMAAVQQSGRMDAFLEELERDPDLDDETKESLGQLARDEEFLLAVEEYCHRTETQH